MMEALMTAPWVEEEAMTASVKEEAMAANVMEESMAANVKDDENGEITTRKMCVLRKPPVVWHAKTQSKAQFPEHQYVAHCPILMNRQFSSSLQLQGGMVLDPLLSLYLNGYHVRSAFRVPSENYHTLEKRQVESFRVRDTQFINIWEEFIHGTSAINKSYVKNEQDRDKSLAAALQNFLSQFLSQNIVNSLIYIVHAILFSLSMCLYSWFWACIGYILLDGHIRIHERAYQSNVNIVFGGSIFQGPAYILVRDWCEHCQQIEAGRMSNRLLKKMKRDILEIQATDGVQYLWNTPCT